MIIKIIRRPVGSNRRDVAGALSSFPRDLTMYVLRADNDALARMRESEGASYVRNLHQCGTGAKREELGATYFRNLVSSDPERIAIEFEARLAAARLSNNYVHHIVLSVRPGEDLENHIEDAAAFYLGAMGYQNCPAVAGEHRDTQNRHLHIVVAPVDVISGEEVSRCANDQIRSQMAAAVLCDRFSWTPEQEARFSVRSGLLVRDRHQVMGRADDPTTWPEVRPAIRECLSNNARQFEKRTGRQSLERIVRETVPALLERCRDMDELTGELEVFGVGLARFGNGASFFNSQGRVKASLADQWSRARIEAKFGTLPRLEGSQSRNAMTSPELTDGQKLREKYETARHDYAFRTEATSYRFKNAGFTDQSATIRRCNEALQFCTFPSLQDWLKGARPFDPVEIFCMAFPASAFRTAASNSAQRFARVTQSGRLAIARSKKYAKGLELESPSVAIDLDDASVLLGNDINERIRGTVRTLAMRGHRELVTARLTPPEQRLVEMCVAELGMTVQHAKSEQEITEISRQNEASRLLAPRARRMPVDPPFSLQTAAPTAARSEPDASLDRRGSSVGPYRPPGDHASEIARVRVSAEDDEQIAASRQKVEEWHEACRTNDPQADRLAFCVFLDEQARAFAQEQLSPTLFGQIKDGHRRQLDRMQQAVRVQQGLSR